MGAKRGRKPLAETSSPLNVEPITKKATKSISRTRVDALLEELDMEVAARQTAILAMTQAAMEALQSEFQLALMSFPRAVQQMPLASFLARFNGDVGLYRSRNFAGNSKGRDAVGNNTASSCDVGRDSARGGSAVAGEGRKGGGSDMVGSSVQPPSSIAGVLEPMEKAPSTAGLTATGRSSSSRSRAQRGSGESPGGAETPLPPIMHTPVAGVHTRSSSFAQTPATVVRAPRHGEVILSTNGSPLGTILNGMVTPMGPSGWGPHARGATATPGAISITATVRRAQPKRGAAANAQASTGMAGRPADGASPEVKSPNIMLTTDAGEVIDIGALRAGGGALPPELGAEVQEKLGRLHDKVSRIMAQLKG